MRPDLHTHTNLSDGSLSPAELVERALEKGITHLAITDHDTAKAYRFLPTTDLTIIPGIELSTRWMKIGIHVVGLNLDLSHPAIQAGIESQQQARLERAEQIGMRLKKLGMPNLFPAATQIAGDGTIGRPHFARALVEHGHSKDMSAAFRKYLGNGKAGDVRHVWPSLTKVIHWIRESGGTAVLAHPAHYKLTATKLRELVLDFCAAGGEALEVVNGSQRPDVTKKLAELSNDHELSASCGSDFHNPDRRWSELGQFPTLPAGVTPVWKQWNTITPFA
ncbi:MAG: PHP domain-containing protein [Gammaproteobacteria bacterium]|nr:PHP domain-containing protein [Gammaproteobacteria bacterium]